MENKETLPLVSVVIPSYNREKRIIKTLESVLKQSYKNYEIIIIDDNSSDNTYEVLKPYISEKILYYKNEKNYGGAKSRNIGVEKSKGSIIAFLDSDDEWEIDKLKNQVDMFIKNKDIAMIYTKYTLIAENTGESFLFNEKKRLNEDFKAMLCNNYIGTTSTICIKKDAFLQIGGFDVNLKACQDWDLYIRVLQKYNTKCVEIPSVKYYFHNESITGNITNVVNAHKIVFEKIDNIIKDGTFTDNEKNIIKSNNYERLAHVYAKFKDIKNARKYFKLAYSYDKNNKNALKHLMASYLGKTLYYKLKNIK